MTDAPKDYYKTMGVERHASHEEIQRAHRKLARKFHPDISKEPNAEARFKEVGEAWAVLKDPKTRAEYDEHGANWQAGQAFRPPPGGGQGFAGGFGGAGFSEGEAQQQSDLFESLFGRSRQGRGGRSGASMDLPGEDQHASIEIELEDAYAGATRKIRLRMPEADGQGQMTLRDREIEFVIPRGVRAGQQIRLAGQGSPGMGSGPAGDLYLEVAFRPHAHYRIEQRDVYLDLPVAPWEAALGADIVVPTPGGAVELKIPAGSASGRKLRLKGRGIPGTGSATPAGDFYFVPQIVLPPADSDAQRSAWSRLAAGYPLFKPRAPLGEMP